MRSALVALLLFATSAAAQLPPIGPPIINLPAVCEVALDEVEAVYRITFCESGEVWVVPIGNPGSDPNWVPPFYFPPFGPFLGFFCFYERHNLWCSLVES